MKGLEAHHYSLVKGVYKPYITEVPCPLCMEKVAQLNEELAYCLPCNQSYHKKEDSNSLSFKEK